MPRQYADEFADDVAEPRVYVNNMNTRHATVTIPKTGAKRNVSGAAFRAGYGTPAADDDDGGDDGGGIATAVPAQALLSAMEGGASRPRFGTVAHRSLPGGAAGGTLSLNGAGAGGGGGGTRYRGGRAAGSTRSSQSRAATVLNGDELHPNLEEVYQRIMRRLQRQLNYDDLGRVPLSEQYGVALEMEQDGEEEEDNDDERSTVPRKGGTTTTSHGENGIMQTAAAATDALHEMNAVAVCSASPSGEPQRPPSSDAASVSSEGAMTAAAAAVSGETKGVVALRKHSQSYDSLPPTAQSAHDGPRRTVHPPPSRVPGAMGAKGVTGKATQQASASTTNLLQPGPGYAGGSYAAGNPYMVRYTNDSRAEDERVDDTERALARLPCPKPLRLVIQHVQQTLQTKIALAERGSVKDCLRFTFESRALLDRLLKEIPSYTQYPNDATPLPPLNASSATVGTAGGYEGGRLGRSVGGGGTTTAFQLQTLFQEFRRQPVTIPRGVFVQDPQTGKIDAALDLTEHRAASALAAATVSAAAAAAAGAVITTTTAGVSSDGGGGADASLLPPLTARMASVSASAKTETRTLCTQFSSKAKQLLGATDVAIAVTNASAEVALPANYGKSARLQQQQQQQQQSHALLTPMTATGSLGSLTGAGGTSDVNRMGSALGTTEGGDWGSFRAAQLAAPASAAAAAIGGGGGDETRSADVSTMSAGSRLRSPGSQPYHDAGAANAPWAAVERGARATQVVDVATLTEENSTNTVPLEVFAEMEAYAKSLEVQLAEARQDQAGLAVRLQEETDYIERKARIVRYLRETLFRECNMLRSQLAFASRKTDGYGAFNSTANASIRQGPALGGAAAAAANNNASVLSSGTSGARIATSNGGAMNTVVVPSTPSNAGRLSSSRHPDTATVPTVGGVGGSGNSDLRPVFSGVADATNASTLNCTSHFQRSGSVAGSQFGPLPPPTGPLAASQHPQRVFADILSVQSLLDLALLAVERDEVLPVSAEMVKEIGTDLLRDGLQKDTKQQTARMRARFEERQQVLKNTIATMQSRHRCELAAKDEEIEQLRKLADLSYVKGSLMAEVQELRNELRKVRSYVAELIQGFRLVLRSTAMAVVQRARLLDEMVTENAALQNTVDAYLNLIEAARDLFLPMLTPEYAHGYHPWPMKLRNTTSPFAHVLQVRYGAKEVARMQDQLSSLSDVYLAIHQFVTQQLIVPDSSRPSTGEPLRRLCAALVLHPVSNTEILFEIRRRYDVECKLTKQLARLHIRLLWNVYLQQAYTRRSVGALAEGNMDPMTTTLPVASKVNRLAVLREALARERTALQKERADNAREVYRLWREKQIDIFHGYARPTVLNRLPLLTTAQAALTRGAAAARENRILWQQGSDSHSTASYSESERHTTMRANGGMTGTEAAGASPAAAASGGGGTVLFTAAASTSESSEGFAQRMLLSATAPCSTTVGVEAASHS